MEGYEERRVWVGCLAAYNAGRLHGEWFDLSEYSDAGDWWEAIAAMLKRSPVPMAEEHHVCDHEGFSGLAVERYSGVSDIWEAHQYLQDCEDSGIPPQVAVYAKRELGHNTADDIENHCYYGHTDSYADYAMEYAESSSVDVDSVLPWLRVDWTATGRDLLVNAAELPEPTGGFWWVESC